MISCDTYLSSSIKIIFFPTVACLNKKKTNQETKATKYCDSNIDVILFMQNAADKNSCAINNVGNITINRTMCFGIPRAMMHWMTIHLFCISNRWAAAAAAVIAVLVDFFKLNLEETNRVQPKPILIFSIFISISHSACVFFSMRLPLSFSLSFYVWECEWVALIYSRAQFSGYSTSTQYTISIYR